MGAAFALTKVVTVPGEHDAPPAPLQVRVTFWLNPLTAVKTTETGVGVPAVIAMVAVGGVKVKVGLVLLPPPDVPLPVPVKVIVAGKEAPLPLMISIPVRAPATVGVKVTPTAQYCPGVRFAVQLFELTLKSVAPVHTDDEQARMLLNISVCDGSVLVMVTVCAALLDPRSVLGNVSASDVGEIEFATGTPVP